MFKFRSVKPDAKGFIDFEAFQELVYGNQRAMSPLMVAEHLIKEFDMDNDGVVNYEEFRLMSSGEQEKKNFSGDNAIYKNFNQSDLNGDRTIEPNGKLIIPFFVYNVSIGLKDFDFRISQILEDTTLTSTDD